MLEPNLCRKCKRKGDRIYCLSCRIVRNSIVRLRKTLSGEVLDECNNLVWELENLLEMEYKYGYEAGRTAGVVETAPGEVAAPKSCKMETHCFR